MIPQPFMIALRCCHAMYWILKHRREVKKSESDQEFMRKLRVYCPSLLTISRDVIKSCDPKETGAFISTMHKFAVLLALYLLQNPTEEQLQLYCMALQDYGKDRHSLIDWQELNVNEIATYIGAHMKMYRESDPALAAQEAALLPLNTNEAQFAASAWLDPITTRFFNVLMMELRPTFRKEHTLIQYVNVSRGFRQECFAEGIFPDPEILTIQTNVGLDSDQLSYQPTGSPVPLNHFCTLMTAIPDTTSCTICAGDVVALNAENNGLDPVATHCGHHFHKECLNTWVNESAMFASNLCPACRTKMCEERPRAPAGEAPLSIVGPWDEEEIQHSFDEADWEDLSDDSSNDWEGYLEGLH